MPVDGWLLVALGVLLVVHVATVGYALLTRQTGEDVPVDADAEGAICFCAECGAGNDPSYRFCRRCVAELPGTASGGQPATGRSHHH